MSQYSARPAVRGATRADAPAETRIVELERAPATQSANDGEHLLRVLPDAVLVHCDLKVVFANDAAARLLGAASPAELIGRDTLSFIHPDFLAATKRRIERIVGQNRRADRVEEKRVRLDGSTVAVESLAIPVEWHGKRAILAVNRDLTERAEAQAAIAANSALLQATVESLNEGLWAFDADLRLLTWNHRAVDILGFPLGMFRPGAPFEGFIRFAARRGDYGPGDPEELLTSRIAIARKGSFHAFERQAANGRIIETRVNPMQGGGFVATFIDITERKAAERAREEMARQLRAQAAELARSNQELEQFAYIASHDLQEPLRMVSSYCQLLARRYAPKLDADAGEFIRFAVDGATRMQTLINDLLAVSRVGRQGKPMRPASLEAALEVARENLKRAIAESGAAITAGPLPTVLGDDVQLAQLFQNLIENAIKFRGAATPRIRIGAAETAEGYEISVADNGIGMEPQYVERIFLMFQRLHDRTKFSGNGIGLAICKKIVERHGGRIWVESAPGRGATFRFTLGRG